MKPVDERRAAVLKALGVEPSQLQLVTPINSQLRMLVKRLKKRRLPVSAYYYLKCSNAPQARKVVELYYSIPRNLRNDAPLEAYCIAASVEPLVLFDILMRACAMVSRQSSAMLAAVNHPGVVEKTIDMALTDDGFKDREVLHKAVGFLPTPKGAQTTVQVTQMSSASAAIAAVAAPPPEATIRRLVNRFNDARQLPADTGSIRVPDSMPHEELEHDDPQEAAALIAAHDEDEYKEEEAESGP